jgi:hypothetical protein
MNGRAGVTSPGDISITGRSKLLAQLASIEP